MASSAHIMQGIEAWCSVAAERYLADMLEQGWAGTGAGLGLSGEILLSSHAEVSHGLSLFKSHQAFIDGDGIISKIISLRHLI